ncbi:alpha/beta hydrolase [Streptomyces sp. HNM0575]|uniref:alpha/beta fold hydrolase n=1 Tax=Streptomyces sp. HNM0575 TaxID=2716338 RepID=UPI00145F03C0|nr:alpha/beta hydrolase [Streptomyces sp. HNM0575]NLU75939.1 alpha/beta hydrolase [Streptomyces sp. HNM0575]
MPGATELPESSESFDSFESFDGTVIGCRRTGSGPPVVMLHGSGGGLHSWQPVAERLADRFELWLPARRGYAPSGPGPSAKRFADEVGDLRALIDRIGGPVHLAGMSYGATVALHAAAARLPLRSLVLWEPPLYAAGEKLLPVLSRYEQLTAQRDRRRADRLLAEEVARIPAALLDSMDAGEPTEPTEPTGNEPADAPGWRGDLEAMAADTADVRRWSAVTTPTFLMRGADTWQPMPKTLDHLATTLPHVTLATFPAQTHFAPSAIPEEIASAIADFLLRS